MSQLRQVCAQVRVVAADFGDQQRLLLAHAGRLRRQAAVAAQAGKHAPPVRSAVAALLQAAQRCERAAAALEAAAASARMFLSLHDGGSGSTLGPDEGGAHGPSALGPGAEAVARSGVRCPAGMAYGGPSDVAVAFSAARLRPFSGEDGVIIHGNEHSVAVQHGGTWSHADATEFATVLRDHGLGGRPVRLVSCHTGARPDGFAQQLADGLDVPVTAPTRAVSVTFAGEAVVADQTYGSRGGVVRPVVRRLGEEPAWRTFQPRDGGTTA